MIALLAQHGWDHHDGAGPLAWALFALVVLALVIAVIAFGVWLLRGRAAPLAPGAPSAGPPEGDPLAVLRLRYARGEIGREDFLRASEDLGEPQPPPEAPPPAA